MLKLFTNFAKFYALFLSIARFSFQAKGWKNYEVVPASSTDPLHLNKREEKTTGNEQSARYHGNATFARSFAY